MTPAREPEVAIIGAGPAGLTAAERLSGPGRRVTVFERMPSVGRKFLMAGRGGLNLTHSEALDTLRDRYGAAATWLDPLLRRFDNAAVRSWCEGLGQPTFVGSSGRVFPTALKASPLLRAWLGRLAASGVEIVTRADWQGFGDERGLVFKRPDGATWTVPSDATILALGGASWPRLGADGGWVPVLRRAGVTVRELTAANAGLNIAWPAAFIARFAGTPLKTMVVGGADRAVRGDLVITAYGLEGAAVYQLGPDLRPRLARDGRVEISLDLKPDTGTAELGARLAKAMSKGRSKSTALRRAGLGAAAIALLRDSFAAQDSALPTDPAILAARLKALPLAVQGLQPLARAISSAGGIAREELDDALMLRRLPGVFAAGEMLDWEAPTGGYLLQACLATGHAAGEGALAWLERSGDDC